MSTVKALLDPYHGRLLAPLLKPRVPGTQGAIEARNHIITELQKSQWEVRKHEFTANTPRGKIPMVNILAEKPGTSSGTSPSAGPKLTLAAHYDSKITPDGFVGAIDSAFPCALLLYLASISKRANRDFDLIFFDGEEAFENWSDEDSIYGAKALAAYQERTGTLPQTLVLLDLLGNKPTQPIPSWFPETQYLHKQLQSINPHLVGGRNMHEYAGMMQDDHLPYLHRGVPVLHLIPWQFPSIWHTKDDDADALHFQTMQQWASLFEEWLFMV